MAQELLNKQNAFITVLIGEKEYMINKIRRMSTHANIDDTNTYLTLVVDEECVGNIKRC